MDLKFHIIKDFKGVLPDIENDYEETNKFDEDTIFYTWIEEGRLLGYMGIIRLPHLTFCSYTKVYNRKIFKKMYSQFKECYVEAEAKGIPIVTDGTNFMHCKNHVTPIEINGIKLYQWNLNK